MSESRDTDKDAAQESAEQAAGTARGEMQSVTEGGQGHPYGSPSAAPDSGDTTPLAADLESGAVDQTQGKNPDEKAAGPAEEADPGTDLPVNTGAVE